MTFQNDLKMLSTFLQYKTQMSSNNSLFFLFFNRFLFRKTQKKVIIILLERYSMSVVNALDNYCRSHRGNAAYTFCFAGPIFHNLRLCSEILHHGFCKSRFLDSTFDTHHNRIGYPHHASCIIHETGLL